jgi:type I restriction enzyme S subunit
MNKINENRKGYKKTKVGWIPDDWKVLPLKKIAKFRKGKGIKKSSLTKKGVPCIRYGEIYTSHNYNIKKFYSYIPEEIKNSAEKIYFGDILFAGSGETKEDIGKAVTYLFNKEAYAGGDIIIMSQSKNNSEFLGYLLNSELIIRQKSRLGQGNSVVHIYSKNLEEILIPLPKFEEQVKIAKIFSTLENLLIKTNELIELKTFLKKGLMQKVLQGKKRFKEFINVKWKKEKIKKYFDVRNDKTIKSKNLPLYSLTIEKGIIPKSDRYNREFLVKSKNKKYKKSYLDDIVFNPANLRYGAIARNNNQTPILLSPIYEILFLKDNTIASIDYFSQILTSDRQINIFSTKVEGTLIERMAVKINTFLNTKLFVSPSINEQKKISNMLNKLDEEIRILKESIKLYEKQRAGLMQKLLTGNVRVKV